MVRDYLYPDYEVIRNADMCIACRVCERQCANEVHKYDADLKKMVSNTASCVDCQRCVCLCPTHALKVIKSDNTFKINANWTNEAISDIIRQAGTGAVLLSAMGLSLIHI